MQEPANAATAPPPAPGAERHPALDFANSTLSLPGNRSLDLLGDPASATRWLADHALAPADTGLQQVCVGRLQEFRAQLRTLLGARLTGLPAPSEALSAVNDALTSVPSAPLLHWDEAQGLHRARPHPTDQIVDHVLALLAADAADLLTGPDAERLASCGAAPCTRYLVRTHGARHWCSVRCGDRARAARAYAKRTGARAAPASEPRP
ncbi:CGNR zinc finger domain-containing protein [Kitasatospora sp. NBC_00315]|uniref:CGNR zinc finger domain-containing protein n=1 Tax=Kitasatospora sp. NBC_00315 TaxID=2975963 RepID=UPI0032433F95